MKNGRQPKTPSARNSGIAKSRQRSLRARRIRFALIAATLLALFMLLITALNQSLRHGSHFSGYALFAAILFLAAFNLRKKIPFLPALGTARTWMQLHIWVGLSTFVMFATHVGWRIPDGQFESLLAGLYLFVALSGVYGLYMTRILPRRLTNLKTEVVWEQIPFRRQRLATQARLLVLSVAEKSDVLARFYANRLAAFFERPRGWGYAVSPSSRECRQLVEEIHGLDRYLADHQRNVSRQLANIVQEKDDLDYHRVVQGRLKIWLFLHIATTYSLVLFSTLHGILALAFSGGLR